MVIVDATQMQEQEVGDPLGRGLRTAGRLVSRQFKWMTRGVKRYTGPAQDLCVQSGLERLAWAAGTGRQPGFAMGR